MKNLKISTFGEKFTRASGITELMKDLAKAFADDSSMRMLGGGNPAHINDAQDLFHKKMLEILGNQERFKNVIGNYDGPKGNEKFLVALSKLLNKEFSWNITSDNIALTNGSQSAFFLLFNMFAGKFSDGKNKKILLPLAPEYIGYSDIGLTDDFFVSYKPEIEFIDEHTFKYHVDFKNISVTEEIGAICVSRPTNPTGNVLTNLEIEELSRLAGENNIPLIIDNAYGTPFPNIIFVDAEPVWNEHSIICMSLSKLGLPTTRTGIVIADEEIISKISGMNAILNLAPGGMGASIAIDLVKSGEIISMSRQIIKPFYYEKVKKAVALVREQFDGLDYYIHKPEGALFLWLWFKNLPITCYELYERLKKRGVLVVPGNYFFPGMENESWKHKDECIRITYSQNEKTVEEGIKIIADEVRSILKW